MAPARSALRVRVTYVVLALATIGVGLLVHGRVIPLGGVTRDVLGDALWAMMIAWWLGALVPAVRPLLRGAIALALCFAVEFSQMYHTPWLDALRRTRIGILTLGSGFDARDLVAYAGGVAAAVLLETLFVRRRGEVRS